MPRIYLCFVWHMHQPLYKDLMSGRYHLPWTRMHALKDYYGMVRVLQDFPTVHQTFNLVPSLMMQIEDYAAERARDPFLDAALKPADELTKEEQAFVLRYFFQANPSRLIFRYPRYGELLDAWQAADRKAERARRYFGSAALRDLQLLSQLAWFDEEYLEGDPDVSGLVKKGRDFSEDDKVLLGRKQVELLKKVLPVYAEFARKGQIELSTTPFYHPILPLLCDTDVAAVAHPYVPLPRRFSYPDDARVQLERSREFCRERLGVAPAGLWPSEGSVSDAALNIAAETGFRWFGTDNGVLARTLQTTAGPEVTYKPYVWRQDGNDLHCIFRDHHLSDLIGFVYSRMEAKTAATHFLERVRENCEPILLEGRSALVPVILDGENAWEYYDRNGRPFLRELYRQITEDRRISAVTVSEALERVRAEPLDHIFPGSWINANFDVWIGAEEDNLAWDYLTRARETYDRVIAADEPGLSAAAKTLAFEELLIAEGSDWNWWYGPEHSSDNREDFDRLYREHLSNVYRALGLRPPDELSRPIVQVAVKAFHEPPAGPLQPVIDGEVTSYFEWMGAGLYRVDGRSGAMHGQRFLMRELHYGCDGVNLYLRVDFEESASFPLEVRLKTRLGNAERSMCLRITELGAEPVDWPSGGECAYRRMLEMRLPFSALGSHPAPSVHVHVSIWQEGLPVDSIPPQDWLDISTADPAHWPL